MAKTIVSVSFSNGFVGTATNTNVSSASSYLNALGWSNFQFQQATDNGLFGGTQGNDLSGTILITDALGVQHRIDGVINWRAPSGDVSTVVFYATGSTFHSLAVSGGGTRTIDPFTEVKGDPHSFVGLTFNGETLAIEGGEVNGNAATKGLLESLNTYLANQPQLRIGDVTVNEGAGTATVTVTLSKPTTDVVTVKYATQDGTGSAGTHYTGAGNTLTFGANQTTQTITVPLVDNASADGARNFSIVLSDSSFAAIVDNTGVVTINDNDSAITVTGVKAEDAAHPGQLPADTEADEGGALAYTVTLSGAAGGEFVLALGGTAGAGDRGALVFSNGVSWKNGSAASGTIVVPAGVASFKVSVPTVDDSDIESAETVVLTVGGMSATGAIVDNDRQTVTGVLAEDSARTGANPVDSAVEEGASLLYTVALSGASPVAVEHLLAVSGTAGAGDRGAFVFNNGVAWKNNDPQTSVVVVPSGVSSFTVTVPTIDDLDIENAETVILSVGGKSATGTVTDDDGQSVSSVLAEDAAHTGANPVDASVEEGANLLYTVSLNTASPTPVEHLLAVSGSSAATDFGSFVFSAGVTWKNDDAASGIIVVPAGVSGFTILVPTADDALIESAETLVLTLGGVAATGIISDDDSQAVISVLAEDAARAGANPVDATVEEGAPLLYTVTLNGPSPVAVEHLLAVSGTADASDRGAFVFGSGVTWKNNDPQTGIVVVPAGVSSFTVGVATVDDSQVETAESLVLSVGGIAATGTIVDNDRPAIASVLAEDAARAGALPVDSAVIEGGALQYTVSLTTPGAVAEEFLLGLGGTAGSLDHGALAFSDGVAWKNGDPATGVLVVPAGIESFRITVVTSDDSLVELAESLSVTVGGVSGTGTITDNDAVSVASVIAEDAAGAGLTPADSSVTEGAILRYTVQLSAAGVAAGEFQCVFGGSADALDLAGIAFSDGVAWKNGDAASRIIVVPAGVAGFQIVVTTTGDKLIELSESLVATVGGVAATGTILDNDSQGVSSLTAEDAASAGTLPVDNSVVEGNALLFTATLNAPSPAATEYTLALGGSAGAADLGAIAFGQGVTWKNNNPASGIVVVPPGVSAFTVVLQTNDDSLVEAAESVVLSIGGTLAAATITDNDNLAPAPTPAPAPAPTPAPAPVLETGLDPDSDDGASNSDTVTSVRTPEFTLGGSLLAAGGSVRLLSPEGAVVGATAVTEADVRAGRVNVGPGPLDDGVYTYTAQVFDASGKLLGSAPVSVTVVTDLDGVAPSIELAAHGGDYNRDGILDWNQHSVAHMPLRSLADFALGKDAPVAAFGAIMAGSLGTDAGAVDLTQGAQLKDLSLSDLPAALPQEFRAASPVFNFTVGAEADVPALPDLDPSRAGLQTRVVIDLGANGAVSNNFMKFDQASRSWYSFLDDQDLATMDDGATLVDLNNDGRVDRIVLTLTDGAKGDDDGVADGKIVDPGLLAFDTTPPDQVYSVRLDSGETYYTADITDAQVKSSGTGNVFLGVAFDSMVDTPDAKHVSAFYQPFTQDMTFTVDGQAQPYACYELIGGAAGFFANAAGKAAVDIHLYQDGRGMTELVSQAQAQELGLAGKGFLDRSAQFSVSVDNAFRFDAEGYLIANQESAAVQALVKQLAASYSSTSAAGFVEAVEQNYFEQIKLVGVAHGAAATAADLNAVFGTGFGN